MARDSAGGAADKRPTTYNYKTPSLAETRRPPGPARSMRTDQFLKHHGVTSNPFTEEDAQTDPVFKSKCRGTTFHPAWDKVFGEPTDPATSIVFGEKGAGKTAMRLQVIGQLASHNKEVKQGRLWVIEYDDFNPFLDRFADRLSARKQRDPAKVLAEWKLWDHMDAILSLGVTDLVDHLLDSPHRDGPEANRLRPSPGATQFKNALDRSQKRDLLLLAACYDNSTAEPFTVRWKRLKRAVGYGAASAWGEALVGLAVTAIAVGAMIATSNWGWLSAPWVYLAVAFGWLPWVYKWARRRWMAGKVSKHLRVLRRDAGSIRELLMSFASRDLLNQPLPDKNRTDDRYELLGKLQGVLRALGVTGVVVLVDRVDEPHLLNGKAELMRDLVWSMLDNKFLKQPGIGLKLLLPSELAEHVHREDRDFHQRSRLDKQNMVPSLDWTGEALWDLTNDRIAACSDADPSPTIREMISADVSDERLLDAFRSLRTPRHLFKFLFRLISTHCSAHKDTDPAWKINRETFESVLAVYTREQAAVDRGLSVG